MSHVWYVSTRILRNPLQNRLAHVIGEHMGYGSYRTLCSKNIRLLVDHRERVDISKLPEKALCPRCRKLTQRATDGGKAHAQDEPTLFGQVVAHSVVLKSRRR